MYQPVWWPDVEALDPVSGEQVRVSVFLWDWDKREGKARASLDGPLLGVSMTDYMLCDLTVRVVTEKEGER